MCDVVTLNVSLSRDPLKKKSREKQMNNQYFSRLASKPVKRKFSQEVKSSTKEEFEQTKKKKKKQWKGSRKRYVATSTFSKKTRSSKRFNQN